LERRVGLNSQRTIGVDLAGMGKKFEVLSPVRLIQPAEAIPIDACGVAGERCRQAIDAGA